MGATRKISLAVKALGQHAAGRRITGRTPLRADEVLAKVLELPVSTWNYTFEPVEVVRCGPLAQDFYKAFGFGATDTRIPTESAIGVLLVSVQALARRLAAVEQELELRAAREEPVLVADGP